MTSDALTPAGSLAPAEFVRRWGDGLARPRAEAVAGLRVSEEAKLFLLEAGLPERAPWDLAFDFPGGAVPRLRQALGAEGRRLPREMDRYRRLGMDAATHICLDEGAGGRVVAIGLEPWRQLPVRAVSIGVPQLAELLLLSRDFRDDRVELRSRQAPPAQVADLVRGFGDELRRADPQALADPEGFFAVIVEQIETGLL